MSNGTVLYPGHCFISNRDATTDNKACIWCVKTESLQLWKVSLLYVRYAFYCIFQDAQSIDVIEDEDSDSSSFDTESDGDEPVNLEQRLDDFRDQWHQELNKKKSAQSKHNERKLERKPRAKEEMSIIEKV